MEKVRKPVVADMFYPSDPHELRRVVNRYLGNVEKGHINGKIVALISPHAGYAYSGQVAAYAYKLVEGMDLDDVVVIGPSHRFGFLGASIYDGEGYETPLGIVPIDRELSRRIGQQSTIIDYIPQAHAQEHSLEVQIPFLQSVLKGFSLVPIVMGPTWNFNVFQQLSHAIIRSIKGKKALIIASSDLTHSYDYRQVVAQDEMLARHIEREGDDSRPGATILITQATYGQVKDHVQVDPDIPPCQAKGKAEPIRVYRVLGLSTLEMKNRDAI